MWTPYFFFQKYLALPKERPLGRDEPYPCPDRKIILPEPVNDIAGWPEGGCEADEWPREGETGLPAGVPTHAAAGG